MTSPTGPRAVAEPISAKRRRRLVALGRLHDEWVDAHLPDTGYREQANDYNVHFVDMDATPEAQDEFHARADDIMGVAPPNNTQT